MHILLIADGRSPITIRWIERLIQLEHRVTLLSSYPCSPLPGLEALHIFPLAFSGAAGGSGSTSSTSKLRRLVRSFRGMFLSARYVLGPLSIRRSARHYQKLVNQINPDLIHALRIPYEGMLASFTPPGIPLALSIWGNDLTLHAPASRAMAALTRQSLRRADGLLADVERDLRLAQTWGFDPSRPMRVIPGNGGIDLDVLQRERGPLPPELEARIPPGCDLVINPRGIRAYARTDTFFQAIPLVLERRPNTAFIGIAMQNQPEAERWVQQLHLDERTALLPALTQGQLWGLFARAPLSLSITTHDGTPNSLLEAMTCGSFPIAGDLDSLREWITPGVNGLLVEAGSPQALAEAILLALENPTLRASAARENLQLIQNRAEISQVLPQMEVFYQWVWGLR